MGKQQKQPARSRKQELRAAKREEARRAAEQAEQRRRLLMIIGAVAGVAVIAAVVLILINRDDEDAALPPIAAAPAAITVQQDGLTLGDPSAPVHVVEYGDYQCPFCGNASRQGLRPMIDEYIATGEVHFQYIPMSFLGDESIAAAEAALCANQQGRFWEMHESIYNNQFGENRGAFSRSRLDAMAERIGLDMASFGRCMDNNEQRGAVDNYANVARQAGVSSTPTFIINNGEPVGWNDWNTLKAQIESALGR